MKFIKSQVNTIQSVKMFLLPNEKKSQFGKIKSIIIATLLVTLIISNSFAQTRYSGSKHTTSHGGHYSGGRGSTHKGGRYRNASTNNHYGKHK